MDPGQWRGLLCSIRTIALCGSTRQREEVMMTDRKFTVATTIGAVATPTAAVSVRAGGDVSGNTPKAKFT
jgi:hypothetical protein